MPDDFCRLVAIYGLIDPRTGCIRYVGKSCDAAKRFKEHLSQLRGRSYKSRWVASLVRSGLEPELVVLQFVQDSAWQAAEQWWIAHFREHGADLTNETGGGEGWHNPSPELRARWSEMHRGKKLRPRRPEHAAAIARALTGRKMPEEQKAARRGKRHSEETKAKMAEAHKALPPEHWDYLRGRNLSPEHRAKIAAGCSGKTRIQCPPDDELERMLDGHSLASVARGLGINNAALHQHVKKMRARREAAPPE